MALACGLLLVLKALQPRHPLIDLLELFDPGAVALVLAALLACVCARAWLGTALCLAAAGLSIALAWQGRALVAAPASASLPPDVRLAEFNAHGSLETAERFLAWAEANRADIMAIEEAPGELTRSYDGRWYNTYVADPSSTVILSRWPMRAQAWFPTGEARLSGEAALARVKAPFGPLDVFAMHPASPRSLQRWRSNEAFLLQLGRWMAGLPPADWVVAGDLNQVSWSPSYVRFLRAGGLKDADRGLLPHPTFPAFAPMAPIDHVAASPSFSSRGCRRGPPLGSDHLPLFCELIKPDAR